MYKDYSKIVDYFKKNGFNNVPYLLRILSYLPPSDRCEILKKLNDVYPYDINIYDKLSMAYVKNGEYIKAMNLLEKAFNNNFLDSDYFNQLKWKIDTLKKNESSGFGSSINYNNTLELLQRDINQGFNANWTEKSIYAYKEFTKIITEFCNEQIK